MKKLQNQQKNKKSAAQNQFFFIFITQVLGTSLTNNQSVACSSALFWILKDSSSQFISCFSESRTWIFETSFSELTSFYHPFSDAATLLLATRQLPGPTSHLLQLVASFLSLVAKVYQLAISRQVIMSPGIHSNRHMIGSHTIFCTHGPITLFFSTSWPEWSLHVRSSCPEVDQIGRKRTRLRSCWSLQSRL